MFTHKCDYENCRREIQPGDIVAYDSYTLSIYCRRSCAKEANLLTQVSSPSDESYKKPKLEDLTLEEAWASVIMTEE